ncbi:MAG: hypothetical protein Ta2D_13440 [Rickettsiales bacterium]|nr:MAG: hypothetical protein Ta2D_13440 [Rickettsiales bacterium]
MLKRNISFAIILVSLYSHVYGIENIQTEIGFPEDIADTLILNYVATKCNLSISEIKKSEIKNEYEYILNFLDEIVSICKSNINNMFSKQVFNKKYPVIIENKLGFFEERNYILVWDKYNNTFCEMADIRVIDEVMKLFVAMTTYNQFVDYWFLKTGDNLREKYNIQHEVDEAIRLINISTEINDLQR